MKRTFNATIVREDDWYVAQCLQVDVASKGETSDDALRNLEKALALYFEPPRSTNLPDIRSIEVEIGAA